MGYLGSKGFDSPEPVTCDTNVLHHLEARRVCFDGLKKRTMHRWYSLCIMSYDVAYIERVYV